MMNSLIGDQMTEDDLDDNREYFDQLRQLAQDALERSKTRRRPELEAYDIATARSFLDLAWSFASQNMMSKNAPQE